MESKQNRFIYICVVLITELIVLFLGLGECCIMQDLI